MSIIDIAEKVGTSSATVSRVLNNPNYKCTVPGLRDKIWKEAIAQNYVPSESARALRQGKSTVATKVYYINVLMTRTEVAQPDPFFTELLHIIESEIHKNGCILSKVWYEPTFSNDKKCKTLNLRPIIEKMLEETDEQRDGLIIIGKCNAEAVKALGKYYRSMVAVNRNAVTVPMDEILCDGEKIAKVAVEYLISLGHESIAYVGECHNESRYRGYLNTLNAHKIEIDPQYILESRQTEANGFRVMEDLLQSEDCPTGIYCANDITALGMLKCLSKHKNRYITPSIIASDDIEQSVYSKPMLTTVHIPKEEMGKFALVLLLDRIKGGHESPVKMEFEGRLMVRESCTTPEQNIWSDYII